MVKNKSAIKPEYFTNFPVGKVEVTKKGITDEERMLYGLSNTAGWNILTKYINDLVNGLDSLNETAIASGASFEELGRNTLVINLAKGIIKRITDRVNDAKETCEAG